MILAPLIFNRAHHATSRAFNAHNPRLVLHDHRNLIRHLSLQRRKGGARRLRPPRTLADVLGEQADYLRSLYPALLVNSRSPVRPRRHCCRFQKSLLDQSNHLVPTAIQKLRSLIHRVPALGYYHPALSPLPQSVPFRFLRIHGEHIAHSIGVDSPPSWGGKETLSHRNIATARLRFDRHPLPHGQRCCRLLELTQSDVQ